MDKPDYDRSREELLAEIERLRSEHSSALQVMSSMGQGLLIVNRDGRIEYANPAYLQMRGYTAEEFVGQNIFDRTVPAERERLEKFYQMRLAGLSSSYDMWTARKDGSLIYVRVSGVPRWHNGQVTGMISVVTDLTEHKRTQETLAYHLDFEKLITTISTRFINLAPEKIDHVILECLQLVGEFGKVDRVHICLLKANDTKVDYVYEWVSQGAAPFEGNRQNVDVSQGKWWMNKLYAGEVVSIQNPHELPLEAYIIKQRQISLGIRSSLTVGLGSGENLLGFIGFSCLKEERTWTSEIIGVLKIVAETINNALRRKQTEEKLQKSQELYRALTSNFPNGSIFLFDHDLRFTLADGKGLTQAGFSKENIEGKTLWEVLPQSSVINLEPHYRAALAGVSSIFEVTYGDSQTHLVHALPITGQNGEVIAGMVMSQNITQRKQLEQEMLKVQKLESVGVLAGGIAHDFNNILAATVGYLALARQELAYQSKTYGDEQTEVQELLEEAEKSMYRARALTQQLLTFAKGGIPVRKIQALPDLLEQTVNFALRGTSVRAEFVWAQDLWLVNIDEGQINQVIHNLVINAVQAMPNGGFIRLNGQNVGIHQREDSELVNLLKPDVDYVQLSLQDNGYGIEPDVLPKIFDPYFTTKPTGNGLGLATSFSVMRRHEGNITVKSQLGQGTTFYLYLPAFPDPLAMPPSPLKPADKIAQTPTTPKSLSKRILVVDDEQAITNVLSKALTFDGFLVDTAQNGDEAIKLYERALKQGQTYNLVMLDLTLPGGMGGRQIMESLQKLAPDVKAIVISGYSTDPIMANYADFGFASALSKPFLLNDLRERIAKVLKPDKVL